MKNLLMALLLLTSCQKDEQPKPTQQWVTHEGSLIFYLSTSGLAANQGMELYVNGKRIDNYKLKHATAPDCGSIKCYTLTDTVSRWVLWDAIEVGTNNIRGNGALLQVGECNSVVIN